MISVSEKAVEHIKQIMKEGDVPADHGLRIGVKGGGCSGLSYVLKFDSETQDGDEIIEVGGVRLLVDPKSLVFLAGTTLDFSDGLNGKGFTFNNPNATKTCGCGESFSA